MNDSVLTIILTLVFLMVVFAIVILTNNITDGIAAYMAVEDWRAKELINIMSLYGFFGSMLTLILLVLITHGDGSN